MARFVNGTSNFLNVFTGGLVPGSPFTTAAWVRPLTPNAAGAILGGANANSGLEWRVGPTNFDAVKQSIAGIGTAEGPPGLGWHHFIFTYANVASGAFAFYIDGLARGVGTSSSNITLSQAYFMGKAGNGESFTGYISDFIMAKFTITVAEAWALGTGRIRPFTLRPGSTNYNAYYPLNGSTGASQESDYSGNGNTATISGSCPLVADPPQLNPKIIVVMRGATVAAAKRRFPNQPLPW